MALQNRSPLLRRASHSVVSFITGFIAGLAVFLLLGAALTDAVFSALVLAAIVAGSRTLLAIN